MEMEYQSLPSILDELYDKYNLQESVSKQALRDKVNRVCESIPVKLENEESNLLNVTRRPDLKEKKGDAVYYFNKEEKQCLFESDDLQKYLYELCSKQVTGTPFTRAFVRDYENWEKDKADAELANQNYEYLAGTDEFDNNEDIEWQKQCGDYVSPTELKQKKFEIMIEALFLKFFEPVDEELLEKDMRERNKGGENKNTREIVAAHERLKDVTYYCNEKPMNKSS